MTDQWNELQRQQMAEVERMRAQAQQQPPNELQPYDSNYRPPYYGQQPQPQQPPNYGQAQVTHVVTAKNPAVAGLLSFFWPGLGHVYAGMLVNGLCQMLLLTPLIWFLNVTVIGLLLGIPLWIASIGFAVYVAKDYNRRNGIEVR